MGGRFRIVVLGALAVLLLAVVGLSLFFAYDPDFFRTLVLTQVEQQLGRRIEVGEARLQIFPRINVELLRVLVRDVDGTQVFFTADRLALSLKALPLLRHHVVAKRLIVEHPHLELRRDREGRWNALAPAAQAAGSEPSSMGNPLAMLLMIRDTTLSDGDVRIIDEFRPDGVRKLEMKNLEAAVTVDADGRSADVRVTGAVPGPLGTTAISVSGTIVHTGSRIRLDAENAGATGPDLHFDGQVAVSHVDLRQMADFLGPRPLPERLHGTATLNAGISLVPGVVGYDLLLSKMKADVEGLAVTGQASLSGIMAPQATFSVTFTASPITMGELLKRVPVQWLHPDIEAVIADRAIDGTVEVVTATLTGTAAPEPRVSMTGEFKVSHGKMLVGQERIPAHDFTGTLFVEPDRMRVVDLAGAYGPLRVTGGKALISMLDKGPALELAVTGDIPAADLFTVLSKKIKFAPVAQTLGGFHEVKGDTTVDLRIAGPVKNPDELRFVKAEVIAHDVWFRTPYLTERIVDLNGRFVFTPGAVEFDHIAGRVSRTQCDVHGVITIGETPSYQDFTVRARVDAGQVTQWLPKDRTAEVSAAGLVGVVSTLSGPLQAPRMKGAVELKEAQLAMPGVLTKAAGTPAALEFEGGFTADRQVLVVERLDLVISPFRISAKGKVRPGPVPAFEGTIVSGPISLAGLPPDLSLGPAKDGILEISLELRGKGDDWRSWNIGGWVALTDGLIVPKQSDQRITDLYLRLKLVRGGAEIKRLAFKVKDSDVRVSGTIRNWQRIPAVNLTVESSQLDLDLIIPKGKRSPVRDAIEQIAATSRVNAMVSVDRGYYQRFLFTDLSWRLQIRDGMLLADRISGDTDDGHLSGRLQLRLPVQRPGEMEASVQVTGVPFQHVTALFGTDEQLIRGRLSFSGTLQGREDDQRGLAQSVKSLTPLDLTIEDGRILKFSAVTKVLTILNLPTLLQGKVDLTREGMPFDRISALFHVENGVVTADRLLVDSPVMKISGAGKYDMTADQLDVVLATSPFGSYSQMIKSIPLFGKLFKGERQGLDTALFEVKGPLKDARVTYLPIKSFAKGVTGLAQLAFDILINTVTLPAELVAPSEKEPAPLAPAPPPVAVSPGEPVK